MRWLSRLSPPNFAPREGDIQVNLILIMFRRKSKWALLSLIPLVIGVGMMNVGSWRPKRLRVVGHPFQVAFSPDGIHVAVVSQPTTPASGQIEIWRIEAPSRFHAPSVGEHSAFLVPFPSSFCFSGDSKMLICPTGDAIYRWDVATHKKLPSIANEEGYAQHAQVWPHGDTLVFQNAGGVVQRDLKTGKARPAFSVVVPDKGGACSPVAFAPDGRAATCFDEDSGRVVLRNPKSKHTQKLPALFPKSSTYLQVDVETLTFSPDSRFLAVGWGATFSSASGNDSFSSRVAMWDLKAHKLAVNWTEGDKPINAHAFSPDGLLLAAARGDGTVSLRDTQDGQLKRLLKSAGDEVYSVAFSPDGRTLASCSDDGALYLWRIR